MIAGATKRRGYPHGWRARDGDEVIRRDRPNGRPVYADGTPIQLYDRVHVKNLPGVHVVTDLTIRCYGQKGREQTWGGRLDKGGDRWWDSLIEQTWISVDGKNYVLSMDELTKAEG